MSLFNGNDGFKAFDLSGQTAIVTGAATGIGEAIALRLAMAGATIAVVDRDMAGAEQAAGRIGHGAFAIEADVADPESATRAAQATAERTGDLHILINNAGIAGVAAPLWEQKFEDWQMNLAVNLTGVFNFCPGRDSLYAPPQLRPDCECGVHRRQRRKSGDGAVFRR